MSEFKFACPVCGQHITADSSASGKQLECPTCFQGIVAPQAPSGDAKLILSATKASKIRPTGFDSSANVTGRPKRANLKVNLARVLLLLGTGGTAFLLWHNELTSVANGLAERAAGSVTKKSEPAAFQSTHAVPIGINWSLNLSNTAFPSGEVAGRIHGHGFLSERATFKGGRLSMRQGLIGAPDLAITVSMGVPRAEDLAGKAIVVTTNSPLPAPHVVLRWKDEHQEPLSEHIHGGYAMKLIFGPVQDGNLQGRIFISLPDEEKSFVAGKFAAEILKSIQPIAGK